MLATLTIGLAFCSLALVQTTNAAPFPEHKTLGSGEHIGIIGGGMQGLSTAVELLSRGFEVSVFEKNNVLGQGISRRLSSGDTNDPDITNEWGIMHSGGFYSPDSQKAIACQKSYDLLKENSPLAKIYKENSARVGKIIVAQNSEGFQELKRFQAGARFHSKLYDDTASIARFKHDNPIIDNANDIVAILHIRHVRIVNIPNIIQACETFIRAHSKGNIFLSQEVSNITRSPIGGKYSVETKNKNKYHANDIIINMAGLHAENVANTFDHHTFLDETNPPLHTRNITNAVFQIKSAAIADSFFETSCEQSNYIDPRAKNIIYFANLVNRKFSAEKTPTVGMHPYMRKAADDKMWIADIIGPVNLNQEGQLPDLTERLKIIHPDLRPDDIQKISQWTRSVYRSRDTGNVDFLFSRHLDKLSERVIGISCYTSDSPGAGAAIAVASSISEEIARNLQSKEHSVL